MIRERVKGSIGSGGRWLGKGVDVGIGDGGGKLGCTTSGDKVYCVGVSSHDNSGEESSEVHESEVEGMGSLIVPSIELSGESESNETFRGQGRGYRNKSSSKF